jgi:SAM-dependent methyltransferase
MAHQAQYEFFKRVRKQFPDHFKGVLVLDVGSYDVNSTKRNCNTRDLFEDSKYIGIDQREGPGVDIVVKAHEYDPIVTIRKTPAKGFTTVSEKLIPFKFDTIISGSTFEHDKYYVESVQNIVKLLKPGGLFTFTCGSKDRQEHGTNRMPDQGEIYAEDGEYYRNLLKEDFEAIQGFLEHFSKFHFEYQADDLDLYFWGIKNES